MFDVLGLAKLNEEGIYLSLNDTINDNMEVTVEAKINMESVDVVKGKIFSIYL